MQSANTPNGQYFKQLMKAQKLFELVFQEMDLNPLMLLLVSLEKTNNFKVRSIVHSECEHELDQ